MVIKANVNNKEYLLNTDFIVDATKDSNGKWVVYTFEDNDGYLVSDEEIQKWVKASNEVD